MGQNVEIYKEKIKQIERRNKLSDKIREKLEKYFDFHITSYIIDDIVENEIDYWFVGYRDNKPYVCFKYTNGDKE